MTVARTVWFERPGVAALRREPLREPGPGEVRVRAICSGVSAGTERLVLLGRVPPAVRPLMALPAMRGGFELPVAYGYATVGEVLGERVFVLHPHQDVFVVPASALRPLPAGIPAERLVLAANLETAVNVVWDAELGLGDRVVVSGLGVVGLLIAWLCRRAGAAVLGVDRDPARAALAVTLGATAQAGEALSATPAIEAADVLIEASGAPAMLAALVAHAGPAARVVVASWYGDDAVSLPLGGTFHPHRVTLRSSQVANLDARRLGRWTFARRWALVAELLADDALDCLIAPSTPLEEAPALYAELARGVPWHPPQRVLDARR